MCKMVDKKLFTILFSKFCLSYLEGGLGNVPPPPPPTAHQHRQTGQRVRQADTNVVSIKFDKLIAPSSMHAGDPQVCEACSAILSKISKVVAEGDQKVTHMLRGCNTSPWGCTLTPRSK